MDTLSYKTISANKETAHKEWVVVDATDQVVGRLGSKVAKLLRGKYKPDFTPHADCGDNVIIINADKVKFTGNKWNDKVYLRYTGYPGGQREMTPAQLMKKPNGEEKLLKRVVKGMLPKNRLGAQLLGNLYVYAGSEHKHEAQPECYRHHGDGEGSRGRRCGCAVPDQHTDWHEDRSPAIRGCVGQPEQHHGHHDQGDEDLLREAPHRPGRAPPCA